MDTCTISTCGRTIPPWDQPRYACTGCHALTSDALGMLPGAYAGLRAMLQPTRRGGTANRGAVATSAPPLDLAVLALTGRSGVVLPLLVSWVQDWSDVGQLAPPDWPKGEEQQVAAACRWLRWHLDWACRRHPAVDQAVGEIRSAHRQVHAAATGERGERVVQLACGCGGRVPWRVSADRCWCGTCATAYDRAAAARLPLAPRTAA